MVDNINKTTVRRAVILFGPTGSGKTAASLEIAKKFSGQIINADSRQIYKEMPIITAMPTAVEQGMVPHHLFEILEPDISFSVTQWLDLAKQKAEEIWQQGGIPIFVGGTGFYLKVLMKGISPIPEADTNLQTEYQYILEEKGIDALYKELENIDPEWAGNVTPQDTQRILRGLIVYKQTGKKLSEWQSEPLTGALDADFLCLAISPPREILNARIHKRFSMMIENGVVDEVRTLYDRYMQNLSNINMYPALKSIGLPIYADFFEGRISLTDAHAISEQQTRRYAKRQRTWLRNSYPSNAKVFEDGNDTGAIVSSVSKWFQSFV